MSGIRFRMRVSWVHCKEWRQATSGEWVECCGRPLKDGERAGAHTVHTVGIECSVCKKWKKVSKKHSDVQLACS